ncbi:MAG: AAA family ATPase, partial [Anaerolineae bacterium]|nr:AAA family ATPase [Anaerolineae bacterium]
MSPEPSSRARYAAWETNGLSTVSYAELFAEEMPDPEWVVDGFLPPGLTFLAGKPKIGKSWLALQLAQAVAAGEKFLGRPTRQGAVLYFPLEDGQRRTRKRTQRQVWRGDEEVFFIFDGFCLTSEGAVDTLNGAIRATGARLVVIDSFSAARQGDSHSENEAELAQLLYPLSQLGQTLDCALVVVHHMGKLTREDPGLDLRGTSALFAACDAVVGLYRKRGEELAKLLATGRDYEDDVSLAVRFLKAGLWTVAGEADLVETTRAERDILKIVKELGEAEAETIAEALEVSR